MNSHEKTSIDDDVLESLFQHVSARQQPPSEDTAAIRSALHEEWQLMTRRKRRNRMLGGFAIAATLVLGVYLGIGMLGQQHPPIGVEIMASVVTHDGTVWKTRPGSTEKVIFSGMETLLSGEIVTTGSDGLVALTWVNGESVRLNHGSRLKLISPSRVELLTGQVYIDTDNTGALTQEVSSEKLSIDTVFGVVRHIGTQYLTSVASARLDVSVRDGRVAIADSGNAVLETVVHSGQRAIVAPDAMTTLTTIPTHGGDWSWVEQLAPSFVMDGRSVSDLLRWVARETGRDIDYSDSEARRMASGTMLHGSVDLAPMRALDLVLQTSDLAYELDDEVIRISAR